VPRECVEWGKCVGGEFVCVRVYGCVWVVVSYPFYMPLGLHQSPYLTSTIYRLQRGRLYFPLLCAPPKFYFCHILWTSLRSSVSIQSAALHRIARNCCHRRLFIYLYLHTCIYTYIFIYLYLYICMYTSVYLHNLIYIYIFADCSGVEYISRYSVPLLNFISAIFCGQV
jgi:hypothetical protein